MKNIVLFDLGNTLVQYFERSDFPHILKQSIQEVRDYLQRNDMLRVSSERIWQRVRAEDYEAKDYRVRPLEGRLVRIFQLDASVQSDHFLMVLCRYFMKPIFARGRCYEDTLPTLKKLRSRGFKMAIVSNTTWGSPAHLWREEVERLGLSVYMDVIVFCRDVGWRKPAIQIFAFALERLQALPQQCIFVGDDPRWDVVGPGAIGIESILLDRGGAMHDAGCKRIESIYELINRL